MTDLMYAACSEDTHWQNNVKEGRSSLCDDVHCNSSITFTLQIHTEKLRYSRLSLHIYNWSWKSDIFIFVITLANVDRFYIQISQDRVATYLRWGDNFYFSFFYNWSGNATVKESIKLVYICQNSYENHTCTVKQNRQEWDTEETYSITGDHYHRPLMITERCDNKTDLREIIFSQTDWKQASVVRLESLLWACGNDVSLSYTEAQSSF